MRSRLQREVLSLYRLFLRASEGKAGFADHVRHEFRKNLQIPRTEGLRIEYLLRRARKQLKLLMKTECDGMGYFTKEEK